MHRTTVFSKLTAIILVICIVSALFSALNLSASAAPPLPAVNTETRHAQDCTSLSSDALAYYTGNYTYENLSALSGASNVSTSVLAAQNNALYNALQTLMTSTHTFQTSYSGTSSGSLAYYWQRTDAQNGVSGSFVLVYSDRVTSINSGSGTGGFNREHVWPKSNASFVESGGGSDLHHLRPADPQINSTRSNLPFGNVRKYPGYTTGSCYWKTSSLFEPMDNVKGDVARILLYVYVRWGETNIYTDVGSYGKIIESLDTLLEWIKLDPVDTWEMKRNDLIEDVQGNRNVFIDYPELAYLMFGREVPDDLVSPSGDTCSHNWTEVGSAPATCTAAGSTTYLCTYCGQTKTVTQPALGHSYDGGTVTGQPTCTEPGEKLFTCTRCGNVRTETIIPLGHNYDNGVVTVEATCTEPGEKLFTCSRCNTSYTLVVAAYGHIDPDRDGVCNRCGAEVEIPDGFELTTTVSEGMHLLIYHPAQGKVLSKTASGTRLLGTAASLSDGMITEVPSDAALFVVHMSETAGQFYLVADGKYLTTASTGNALSLSTTSNEYSLWRLESAGSGKIYLYSVNAAYTAGNYNQALEYYNGYYTVYGKKATDAYQYQLYAKPGHVWDEGVETAPVTCTQDGAVTYTCTFCGEVSVQTLPATGHNYVTDETPATCTESGSIFFSCANCGDSYTEETPALGHDWDEGVVTAEPQYGVEGTILHTCTRCGEEYAESIPALEYLRGDVDLSGTLTISDVTALLDVLAGAAEAPALAIIDVSQDEDITISDVTALLDLLSTITE